MKTKHEAEMLETMQKLVYVINGAIANPTTCQTIIEKAEKLIKQATK